jgi:phosphotriesterase-related protein
MVNRHMRSVPVNRRTAMNLLLRSGIGCGFLVLQNESALEAAGQQLFGKSSRPLRLPSGSVIRTILKDVSPDVLGNGATWFHEHLNIAFTSPPVQRQPGTPAPPLNLDLVVDELRASARDGVTCIVDAAVNRRSPQQIEELRTIATRSGVHIVIAGGYYRAPYPAAANIQRSEEEIAEELVQDAASQRWGAFGEIGTSLEMHPDERKMLRAVSRAHLRTGVPIFTHNPHEGCPKCPHEQIDVFESAGVNPKQLCVGHLTDNTAEQDPGWQSLRALGKRGVFLGFDTLVQDYSTYQGFSVVPDADRVKMVLAVLDAGYEDQLLFATDFSNARQIKANWGSGLSTILTEFVPKLRYAGVKDNTIRKIIVDNPRRFLAFVPKKTGTHE